MAFDYKRYVDKFVQNCNNGFPPTNNSVASITIPIHDAKKCFAIIGIHKLTPDENVGKHNLFMEVLDENGKRIHDSVIRWGWEGQKVSEVARPVILDKPNNEPAGNIPIWGTQTIWAEVSHLNYPSDRVSNIHTRLPDEGQGNTYGHYSYLVVWMLVDEEIDDIPDDPDDEEVNEIIKKLTKENTELKSKLSQIKELVNDI